MQIEATIRELIPAHEIATIVDNIGLPYSGINLAYSTSAPVGPGDADIFVNLNEDHRPTADYVRGCAPGCAAALSLDDVRVPAGGYRQPDPEFRSALADRRADRRLQCRTATGSSPNQLLAKLHAIPGAVDLRIQQAYDYPQFDVDVDRSKAAAARPDGAGRGHQTC